MLPRHKHNLAKLLLTNLLVKTKKGLHLQHLFAQMRDDSYYEFTFIINICPISKSLPHLFAFIVLQHTFEMYAVIYLCLRQKLKNAFYDQFTENYGVIYKINKNLSSFDTEIYFTISISLFRLVCV